MSAHDSSTGRHDGHDPVADSLRRLGADLVPTAPRGAVLARRSARRRAVARTTGLTVAVVAVLAVVPVAASLGGQQAAPVPPAASAPPSPVAEPSPTASEGPPPTPQPSEAESQAPSPSPSTDTDTGTGIPSVVPDTVEPPVLVVSGDWRAPRSAGTLEGFVPTPHRQYTDGTVAGAGASWASSSCGEVEGGPGYPADRERTGFYSATGSLGDGYARWQAATYADEAGAAQALAEIAAAVDCPGSDELARRVWSVRQQDDDLVVLTWRTVGAAQHSGLGMPENADGYPRQDGSHVVVRRSGDVLALSELGGMGLGSTIALAQGETAPESGVSADMSQPEAVATSEQVLQQALATSRLVLDEAAAVG